MLRNYIAKLRSFGQLSFTFSQAINDLGITSDSLKSAIYRLKKKGILISPAKGFYIIIPPEDRPYGCIPAEELLPLLADHLGFNYYVGLLSAGTFYGAAHQRPAVFQIFVDRKFKKKLNFGKIYIDPIYRKSLEGIPTRSFNVKTGYLRVSTPEVTAMDLLENPIKSGGLNNVATVLSELIESINTTNLLLLARQSGENAWLQRFGYILEKLDPDDLSAKQRILSALSSYLKLESLTYIPLAPVMPAEGFPLSEKWKIIENTTFESDI